MKAALRIAFLVPLAACAADTPPMVGMANPASVCCAEKGGKTELRTEARGVVGYCHLPDGTVVEEWKFFRAHHGKPASN